MDTVITGKKLLRLSFIASAQILGSMFAGHATAQPSGCRPTLADFRSLEHGMRYGAAVARLGCKGRKISRIEIGKNRRVTYSWRGRGSYGANLNLTFRNGRLTDKSQLGLR